MALIERVDRHTRILLAAVGWETDTDDTMVRGRGPYLSSARGDYPVRDRSSLQNSRLWRRS